MRILIAVGAFVITLGSLFLTGAFRAGNEVNIAIPSTSISPDATKKPIIKTASILKGLKNLVITEPILPSPPVSATPSLPALQRLSPTPSISSGQAPFSNPTQTIPPVTPIPSATPVSSSTPIASPTPPPSTNPSTTPTPAPSISPTPSSTSSPTPTPTSNQTSESIYIVSAQPLVYKQKGDAQLQIQTYPQATCSIKVTLPSGSVSGNNALVQKTADGSGFITWIWSISWNTKTSPPPGKIDLNCTYDSQSYSKTVEFTVVVF